MVLRSFNHSLIRVKQSGCQTDIRRFPEIFPSVPAATVCDWSARKGSEDASRSAAEGGSEGDRQGVPKIEP